MTFDQWVNFARQIRNRADRIEDARKERGFAIAATVGLPRNICCIHNASIDTNLTGWSADGPHVWKTARAALHLLNDYSTSRLADRIIDRAWKTVRP